MKQLIVAEKPSVAREIAQVLGVPKKDEWHENDRVIVTSGVGHLVEVYVPEAEEKGAALPIIPAQFALRPIDKTKSQFSLVKKLMARSDVGEIVNACDAGREGELIFRLIYEAAGCKKPTTRVWAQSMTPVALREAYENRRPGSEKDDLGAAARSRAEADWLFGINGSRAMGRAMNDDMPVGRVQTPTLALVVNRHLEIQNFKPRDYYEIHGTFGVAAGQYVGRLINRSPADGEPAERFNDLAAVKAIMSKLGGHHPSAVRDDSKPVSKASPSLYDLTTLQRDANNKFGFSAKETLDIAQVLYEVKKVLTYPRTDSSALPEDYVSEAAKIMQQLNIEPYADMAAQVISQGWIKPVKKIFDNERISDHFAIIPTGKRPEGLSPAEAKIFDLVVRRFIAAFFPAAEYLSTTRTTILGGETFRSSGRVLTSVGWLAVYGQALGVDEDEEKEPALCKLAPGELSKNLGLDVKSLKTKPPKPFTEATLLAAMETAGKFVEDDELAAAMKEKGIGTPATRASMIEKLVIDTKTVKRDGEDVVIKIEPYIRREKKNLIPTSKAMKLLAFLEENKINALSSPTLTGEWEHKLSQVEKGQMRRADFMRGVEGLTREVVGVAGPAADSVAQDLTHPCPNCGNKTLKSSSRDVSCTCGFKLWRNVAQRSLSDAEVEQLLATKQVGPLTGFISSKSGKPFSATLKLASGGKVEFVFDNAPGAAVTAGAPGACKCPKCQSPMSMSPKLLSCSCGLKIWKTIAGKDLTDNQAIQLASKGQIGPLKGFTSRAGKKFEASLKLNTTDGKVEFLF